MEDVFRKIVLNSFKEIKSENINKLYYFNNIPSDLHLGDLVSIDNFGKIIKYDYDRSISPGLIVEEKNSVYCIYFSDDSMIIKYLRKKKIKRLLNEHIYLC
jgi:hypothetical protein